MDLLYDLVTSGVAQQLMKYSRDETLSPSPIISDLLLTMGHWVMGQQILVGHSGHGSLGSWVTRVMDHSGHRSLGSWVTWVMGRLGHGSLGSGVTRVMGHMGHGSLSSWVTWVMGCLGHGSHWSAVSSCNPLTHKPFSGQSNFNNLNNLWYYTYKTSDFINYDKCRNSLKRGVISQVKLLKQQKSLD